METISASHIAASTFRSLSKRKQERLRINGSGTLQIRSADGRWSAPQACTVHDISRGGAGLTVATPLFRGDTVRVHFLDRDRLTCLTGEITRDISWTRQTGLRLES